MKILLPADADLCPALPDGMESVLYDPAVSVPSHHQDAESLVVWGFSGVALDHLASSLPRLRWVQALASGTDALFKAGFADEVAITSGRGLHDRTVTEHTIALMLSLVRRIPEALDAQSERRWATELGGIQPLRSPERVTTLIGARVLVWGFGSIGQTMAPVLEALGAKVTGAARRAGSRSGFPVVGDAELDAEMARTDVLVMLLPSDVSTEQALDARRLACLPAHALLINVGRGSTIDEMALVRALYQREIAGAALDVASIEPLPADSVLWGAPNLIITPHAAGGRPVGADALLSENLAAFVAGKPLLNLVRR